MPFKYTVYECDKMSHLEAPKNETPVAHFDTFSKAATTADTVQRSNGARSYTVGIS